MNTVLNTQSLSLKSIFRILAFLAAACGAAARADGPACTFPTPDDSASGDRFYPAGRWCNDALVGEFWNGFGMSSGGESDGWSGAWGYDDPCNVDLPLGRTFNTMSLLRDKIPAAYSFAAAKIDDLDAVCTRPNGAIATTANCFFTNWTQLSMEFFYGSGTNLNYPIWARAGTLAHEARHYDDGCWGIGYTGHVTCNAGDFAGREVCDPVFARPTFSTSNEVDGARPYSYSVEVLTRYAFVGRSEPRAYRENARYRAQYALDNRFNYVPPALATVPPIPLDLHTVDPTAN